MVLVRLTFFLMSAFVCAETLRATEKRGVDEMRLDAVGLVDCHDLGVPTEAWKDILYTDYEYLVRNVSYAFASSVLAEMATFFLTFSAEPPKIKGPQAFKTWSKGAMLAERIIKLTSLGHMRYAKDLWNIVCQIPLGNPALHRARLFFCLYANQTHELEDCLARVMQQCPESLIKEDRGFWKKAAIAVRFLGKSKEEARIMAEAQKNLMSEGSTGFLHDVHQLILTESADHFETVDPFSMKLILRFATVDADFITELPKQFYALVYYDDAWKTLDDHSKAIILEHLVHTSAINPEVLMNFYAQCDVSTVLPYDRRGVEGAQECAMMNDPLARAVLYKDLRSSTLENRGPLLSRFMHVMARAGLLMAVLPELKRFAQDIKPQKARQKWAPLFLLMGLLCEDLYSDEECDDWLQLALQVKTTFPAVPAYIILRQKHIDQGRLKALFVQWYQSQDKGAHLQKTLWVLAQTAPWLAKGVSLPHFSLQGAPAVVLDTALEWAQASDKKIVMLGASVRDGVVPILAVRSALQLKERWGQRLAVESLLRL